MPLSYARAGTILSSHKYAWSNNSGYINFENVTVDDRKLSGYAWSTNHGWIKFSPTQGGVLNDETGNLSGSAWGEQLGWIDFDNVSINPTSGKFSGTATGTLAGTITFDCQYCDVETNWRQTPAFVAPGGGNQNNSFIVQILETLMPKKEDIPLEIALMETEVRNAPLVVPPEKSGILTHDTPAGEVILEVPAQNTPSTTIFTITDEPLLENNNYLVVDNTNLVNGVFYNISAKNEGGDNVNSFSNPITIILPVEAELTSAKNLAVYWLNETNWQWVLIPDSVIQGNNIVFQVDHLTIFAIFEVQNSALNTPKGPPANLPLPPERKITPPNQAQAVAVPVLENSETRKEQNTGTTIPGSELLAKADYSGNAIKENNTLRWSLIVFVFLLIILSGILRNRRKKNS